jgi:hypothetical protein
MKYLVLLLLATSILSCKKKCASTISLADTQWDLYFKNNNTFNFFAKSLVRFNKNDSAYNYRNFDTIAGTWKQNNAFMEIDFANGDVYTGIIATSDSISGTLTASGNNGVWYAIKE